MHFLAGLVENIPDNYQQANIGPSISGRAPWPEKVPARKIAPKNPAENNDQENLSKFPDGNRKRHL